MLRDEGYLLDMFQAARDARAFAAGLTQSDFEDSRIAQYAVAHALQIVGEAATRISDETRTRVQDIPWGEVVGMRNRLVHDYGRIDRQVLWDTLSQDIPKLIEILQALIEGPPGAAY